MEFRVLGPIEVREAQRSLPIGGHKQRGLLAILLTQVNQVVSTDRLIELLWGGEAPESALNSLQVYVAGLRKVLEPHRSREGPYRILIREPPGYAIRLERDQLDSQQFERQVGAARDALARGEAKAGAGLLREALGLWRGPALADFDEPFAEQARARLDELRLGATEEWFEAHLRLREEDAVLADLEAAAAAHPLRERLQGQLMLALYRSGRQADASDVYQRTRERLRDELGMEPGPELQRLLKQILNQDETLDVPLKPGAAAAPSSNLPQQLTSFVGREREVEGVELLLNRSRVVTLTGAGGIGKTRLALEVASRLVGEFADGVWLVELASLTDPELVPRSTMAVLGLRDQPGRSSLEALLYNLSERHILLVFDNCEHLIDAVANSVERLIRACPRLKVLTTSREVLNVAGELQWQVQSLRVPPPGRALPMDELARYEAVALFQDRAGAVSGSFELTAEMAPVLADVCQRLDGIPLAIELAASRLKVLSLAQVRDRLNDRFSLLAGGTRTALPRQQTLRATIDWSHQLLSPAEQALLRRLSVFSGGCSLDAVEAICAGDPVHPGSMVDILTGLVDKSLVLVEPSPVSARYRFLDTIRDYARERLLTEGEAEPYRNRHFEWFVALTVEVRARLHGPDQLAWLSRLETEHDNLRAAFDWGCVQGDGRTLVMASSLDYFWTMRGYLREGYEKLSKVIAVCQEPGFERAEALTHAARLAAHQAGDYPKARELSLQSLRIRDRLGVSRGLGFALMCLGGTEVALGNVGEGLRQLQRAVAAARDESEPWQLAQTLNDGAMCSHLAGVRGPEPWTMMEESVAILREIGDEWSLSGALDSLALIAFDRDVPDQARLLWAECCRIALRLAEQGIATYALDGMARVAVKTASYGRGLGLHAVAARLRRETGQTPMPDEQASVHASIAAARHALGDAEADRVWRESSERPFVDALNAALAAADGE